ncbi:MAG: hypothetical protein EOO63_07455 [Hymenobacter sp.]|nr:MAG: hypothetical protein EOO63_07455 [Hymenobacter sp.]
MAHLLQTLAHHWHLSASQYWHLRIVCALTLAPLLGVLCLIVFNKREESGSDKPGDKRPMRVITTLRPVPRLPLRPAAS